MLLPKKRKKNKKISPANWNGGNEQKKLKKNVTSSQPVTSWHMSGRGLIPAIWNGGNEENDKKKNLKK